MANVVFIIDTSGSMNQKSEREGWGFRPTLLDVAKESVNTFLRARENNPMRARDRHILMTFDDPPHNIKVGWNQDLETFKEKLQNLEADGLAMMDAGLTNCFDILNLRRTRSGIDTYGMGRYPANIEPTIVVVISDGGKSSNVSGVHEEFNMCSRDDFGNDLTIEPYRWDQRVYSLILRLAGTPVARGTGGSPPDDPSPFDAICEATGGQSFKVNSYKMIEESIEIIMGKIESGVVMKFEKITEKNFNKIPLELDPVRLILEVDDKKNKVSDTDDEYEDNFKFLNFIRVPRSARNEDVIRWPIPESFPDDSSRDELLPRTAHPRIKVWCKNHDPMTIHTLVADEYLLDPSPFTELILAREKPVCWPLYVIESTSRSIYFPFGYLKSSPESNSVHIFLMPYNYPVLIPLLDELTQVYKMRPTSGWRDDLVNYLNTVPHYYSVPLRDTFVRIGASFIVRTSLFSKLTPSTRVTNYLDVLKEEATKEYERMCSKIIEGLRKVKTNQEPETVIVKPGSSFESDISHPTLKDKPVFRDQSEENTRSLVVAIDNGQQRPGRSFTNPFDISRENLVDQVSKMRAYFLSPSLPKIKPSDKDAAHSRPISEMGDYKESLRRKQQDPKTAQPLRNPFKIHEKLPKREVSRPDGRIRGPIPDDFVFRRPTLPSPSSVPELSMAPKQRSTSHMNSARKAAQSRVNKARIAALSSAASTSRRRASTSDLNGHTPGHKKGRWWLMGMILEARKKKSETTSSPENNVDESESSASGSSSGSSMK